MAAPRAARPEQEEDMTSACGGGDQFEDQEQEGEGGQRKSV